MFSSNTTQVSDGGYQISRSLRFNSADSAYLNRTPSTTTNRRTFTFSAWVKLSKTSDDPFLMGAGAGGQIWLNGDKIRVRLNGSPDYYYDTSAVFRDYSAWYHIVVGVDTTNATSADRVKIYVNSTQQAIGASSAPPQNFDTEFNLASTSNNLGKWPSGSQYLNGYMTEINFIDGQALTPSSFGETSATTGVWQPKAFAGTYGTNGFYVNFSDNSNTTAATLGKDYSGNGNNWTPNNFSVTAGAGNDSLVDVPTPYGADTGAGGEVRGNYNTWNPIGNGSGTLTNGNLDLTTTSTYANAGTLGLTSGKWYWEVTLQTSSNPRVGVFDIGSQIPSAAEFGVSAFGWCIINSPSRTYNNNSAPSYGAFTPVNGTIVILAYDADNGRLWYGQDGTWFASGNPATNANPSQTGVTGKAIVPACSSGSGSNLMSINAGQRPFAYTAPSGFKALCTQNLPTPTIGATTATTADKYFGINLWTGNGTSQTLTNSGGFQPDWVWLKSRSSGTNFHNLYDVLRGATKHLFSNSTAAEGTNASALTAFTSTGFSVGNDNDVNQSSSTYVGWQWKANGSGSTNTSGSITSTVSANTTSGFSVVTFTGTGANATVGHGLGVAPAMIIEKNRISGTALWFVYHRTLGATKFLRLNADNAEATNSGVWNDTAPTSSVISIGSNPDINGSGQGGVFYCFAEVAGYSAFGSYTGNGSSDGPFVFTGMRPAFVMVKRTNDSGNWQIFDDTRSPINAVSNVLVPNSSSAEVNDSNRVLDFVSNGFKLRVGAPATNDFNASGSTYIYAAFAESPFKFSLAR